MGLSNPRNTRGDPVHLCGRLIFCVVRTNSEIGDVSMGIFYSEEDGQIARQLFEKKIRVGKMT